MKNQFYILKGFGVALFLLLNLGCLHAKTNPDKTPIVSSDSAQSKNMITIEGHIRDGATKLPLLGAKVQSKNQKYSAITDENGFFYIAVPNYSNSLYVSATDYSVIEYPLQGKSKIDISLYGVLPPLHEQSALTVDGQIQSILASDVRVINHSGAPAIGSSMFIRGFNSLNINSQPLIVLDGIVLDNQNDRASIHQGFMLNRLSNISVDDIESVQVVKDGTALYGSKGGNGVLLINTKRGKDPVTQITVSSMFGYSEKPKTTPLMNASQYRVYVSDLLKGVIPDKYISLQPFLNDNPSYYDYLRYHNENNWSDNVYQNGATQSYNVNVSGGDNVALYNLSMGYAKSNSTLIANDFARFNTRFNSDVELSKQFKFSFDLGYSQTDRNLRDDGFSESPTDLITSPAILAMVKTPFLIPYEYSNSGAVTADLSDADAFGIANPLSIIQNGIGLNSQNYLTISVKPQYSFTNELKLCALANYSLNTMFEKYFQPNAGVPSFISSNGDYLNSHVKGQNSKQISMSTNVYLNWNKEVNIHAFDVTGGFRYYNDTYQGEYASGYNTPTDLSPNLTKDLTSRQTAGYDDSWRSLSWYANAEYSLLSKYFLTGVVSADASSRFGKDADLLKVAGLRWGIFPSLNAAWLVSSENFMKHISLINMMKLRFSYGLSGNDNIPTSSSTTYFSSIQYLKTYTGLTLSNIGNTTLKPETVEKTNLGIDLNLLNNRLSLSADIYHHITRDLLGLRQLSYLSGLDTYWSNEGKLQNNGIEFSVNAKVIAIKNFQWELGGSIAHYKNEILELPGGNYTTSIYGGEVKTMVGQSAGVFYGYKTLGVFADTKEAAAANLKIANVMGTGYTSFAAGDMHFADLHKDNIIDEKDKTIIGDPNPDFTGSFNTRFVYKNLSLTALFTYSYGNDVYNYVRSQLESGSNFYNQSSALQNRWVSEGQQTSIPRSSFGDVMGNNSFSDRWIEDGSYLRLKSLTLSYDVPVKSTFLSGFTIWASANNLLTFTKYLGADPEFSIGNSVLYQGIDAGLLPQGRSCFVGLKLNL